MQTRILPANEEQIAAAAQLLLQGELVAFPTETVYGLGANALDASAVAKIFTAKDRPADNPLIVHISDYEMLDMLVSEIPAHARTLMEHFWPGPLSLVLPKRPLVPAATTAGLDTVVVRFPSHPTARTLISAAGTPIAAPSANRSGHVSPTTAEHVAEDLSGRIPFILDAGTIEYGLESTVVDCTSKPPLILRPGSITLEMLQAVVPNLRSGATEGPLRSPGMKYRHYSPHTPLTLFVGDARATRQAIDAYVAEHPQERVAVIAHSGTYPPYLTLPVEPAAAAPLLYSTLRAVDTTPIDRILVQGYEETGVGVAIMNRLRKAAESVVVVP